MEVIDVDVVTARGAMHSATGPVECAPATVEGLVAEHGGRREKYLACEVRSGKSLS
jgi:hypothetical protein